MAGFLDSDLVRWIATTGGFVAWALGVFEVRNRWPKVRFRVRVHPCAPSFRTMHVTVENVRSEPTSMEPMVQHDYYPLPERRFGWPRRLLSEWQLGPSTTGELLPHQERQLTLHPIGRDVYQGPWVLARARLRLTRGRSATEWEHMVLGRIGRLRFWWHWLRLWFNSVYLRSGPTSAADWSERQARKR